MRCVSARFYLLRGVGLTSLLELGYEVTIHTHTSLLQLRGNVHIYTHTQIHRATNVPWSKFGLCVATFSLSQY